MADAVQGLAEAYTFLGTIDEGARDELGVEIAIVSREILAAQKADVAKDTGKLEAALSLQLQKEKLRARIGLLIGGRDAGRRNGRATRAVAGGPFYGRIVEHGRPGQTVVVTRRIKQRRVSGSGRTRKDGTVSKREVIYRGASSRLRRRGENKGTPIGSPYKMRVKALPARPFVAQPLLADAADQHLAEYWSRLLARRGGA